MNDTGVADFRSAVRQALETAEADGVPLEAQITLLVSEIGNLVAGWARGNDLEPVIGNLQQAVAHAVRTAQEQRQYQEAVERFVERWLN